MEKWKSIFLQAGIIFNCNCIVNVMSLNMDENICNTKIYAPNRFFLKNLKSDVFFIYKTGNTV